MKILYTYSFQDEFLLKLLEWQRVSLSQLRGAAANAGGVKRTLQRNKVMMKLSKANHPQRSPPRGRGPRFIDSDFSNRRSIRSVASDGNPTREDSLSVEVKVIYVIALVKQGGLRIIEYKKT